MEWDTLLSTQRMRDVYKRQELSLMRAVLPFITQAIVLQKQQKQQEYLSYHCLLYTSRAAFKRRWNPDRSACRRHGQLFYPSGRLGYGAYVGRCRDRNTGGYRGRTGFRAETCEKGGLYFSGGSGKIFGI